MEDKKRGRPTKFNKELMLKMKAVYSGTRAGNRHLQNHYYQTCSYPLIKRYHDEYTIENFEFLYKDDMHLKETVFTELGRTNDFICQYYSKEEADDYIINLTKEICQLAKENNNKITSRIIERIIREDRQELKKRLKE